MQFWWFSLLLLTTSGAAADSLTTGARLFHLHCATCHGENGKGNGPMAEALSVAPTDLTQLAKTHNGRLPIARIAQQIDGRAPLPGHGGTMPVYGYFLEGPPTLLPGTDIMSTKPVADLIIWLERLQSD